MVVVVVGVAVAVVVVVDPRALALSNADLGAYVRIKAGGGLPDGWPERATLLRCSVSSARRTIRRIEAAGLNVGPSVAGVISDRGVKSDVKSDRGGNNPQVLTLWALFVKGRRGSAASAGSRAPRGFAEAVRAAEMSGDELAVVVEAAGRSYASWSGPVRWENMIGRGVEGASVRRTSSIGETMEALRGSK